MNSVDLTHLPVVVLACRVFQHWLENLLPEGTAQNITFFDYGLHAVPRNLRQTIQQAIDVIAHPSLVVLGYGLCGNGLDKVQAGKHYLLIPRTDDCIAIMLGSYQAYRREMKKEPGTYYLSKGWLEAGTNPLAESQKYAQKYDAATVDYLMDTQYKRRAGASAAAAPALAGKPGNCADAARAHSVSAAARRTRARANAGTGERSVGDSLYRNPAAARQRRHQPYWAILWQSRHRRPAPWSTIAALPSNSATARRSPSPSPSRPHNAYAAAIAVEEVMKRRILTVEADGALIVIPFDNVKYISAYPGTGGRELRHVIRGATLAGSPPRPASRLRGKAGTLRLPSLRRLPPCCASPPFSWRSSFIGRAELVTDLAARLTRPDDRLITLTGSGGVGKTRLALEVAHAVRLHYPHGVWFIDLAPLGDPQLVPQAVVTALEIYRAPDRPVLNDLIDRLRDKHVLLVLNNCEHLIAACAQLADQLLQHCPELHLLATSREALGIQGEASVRVPSLSLPAGEQLSPEGLVQSEAVQFFLDRAAAVRSDFALTTANALAVMQICRRLDGIALAIELAASRVKLLTVEQIAARLDNAFHLLTGGSRTALPRQQTLIATIDWSYNLLTDPERALLHGRCISTKRVPYMALIGAPALDIHNPMGV